MVCRGCTCGKSDNIKNKTIIQEKSQDTEVLNRLYLLGYLSNPVKKTSISEEDEILNNVLSEKFPDDVEIKDYFLKPKSLILKEFLEKGNFQSIVETLHMLPKSNQKHFWRGYIDYISDSVNPPDRLVNYPKIKVSFNNDNLFTTFLEFLGISECSANIFNENNYKVIEIINSQAFDLMYDLYKDTSFTYRRSHWVSYIISTGAEDANVNKLFKFMKTRPDAVNPFKARASDSGYDLTILEKVKTVGKTQYFDTGIVLMPAFGFYFDLVPRSSISKTNFMLSNSVGVIDASYRGNILVPLIKIDDNSLDLELPNRIVQIIPRKIMHIDFEEVTNFDQTNRGSGSFGSSG